MSFFSCCSIFTILLNYHNLPSNNIILYEKFKTVQLYFSTYSLHFSYHTFYFYTCFRLTNLDQYILLLKILMEKLFICIGIFIFLILFISLCKSEFSSCIIFLLNIPLTLLIKTYSSNKLFQLISKNTVFIF